MGIAISAVHSFFAPLQGFLAWLVPGPTPAAVRVAPVFVAPQPAPVRAAAPKASCTRAAARVQRPLRVVRVMDKSGSRSTVGAGRMVISGRMADVCAELDRLAAMEAGAAARH
jgi:hypothetical protein